MLIYSTIISKLKSDQLNLTYVYAIPDAIQLQDLYIHEYYICATNVKSNNKHCLTLARSRVRGILYATVVAVPTAIRNEIKTCLQK